MANADMLTMVQQTVTQQIEEINNKVDQINAATQDKGKVLHDIRTNPETDDEQIKAHQEWVEKAQAAIEDAIKRANEYIQSKYLSAEAQNVDVDALKEEVKELRSGVKSALTFVATLPGYDAEKFTVPEMKNLRGGTSGATGTGGKRPRLAGVWVNNNLVEKVTQDKQGNDVHTSNFTLAAAYISKDAKVKVEVKDLQAAAFEAAKTDDLSTLAGQMIEFAYTAGEKSYDVRVLPKSPDDSTTAEGKTDDSTTAETESVETVESE